MIGRTHFETEMDEAAAHYGAVDSTRSYIAIDAASSEERHHAHTLARSRRTGPVVALLIGAIALVGVLAAQGRVHGSPREESFIADNIDGAAVSMSTSRNRTEVAQLLG